MQIFIEREKKNIVLDVDKITGSMLVSQLGLRISEVLIIRNDEIVTEDILLQKEDNIKILSVISGG